MKDGECFRIDRSALTLKARISGIDAWQFDEIAQTAKSGYPMSRLFNTEITMDATLE